MAENMTIFTTGLTYSRNTKAPLMDKQVFETLALAQAYVDNVDQTAYVGLTLSVVNDGSNNGLYYVERIADAYNETGLLVKVGSYSSADVAEIKANAAAAKAADDKAAAAQTYAEGVNTALGQEVTRATEKENELAGKISTLETAVGVGGSVETQINTKIESLNADVTSAEGTQVRVQVVEENGKITAVNVTESATFATAHALADEIADREADEQAISARIDKAIDSVRLTPGDGIDIKHNVISVNFDTINKPLINGQPIGSDLRPEITFDSTNTKVDINVSLGDQTGSSSIPVYDLNTNKAGILDTIVFSVLNDKYTKEEIDTAISDLQAQIGNISTVLDNINGEII